VSQIQLLKHRRRKLNLSFQKLRKTVIEEKTMRGRRLIARLLTLFILLSGVPFYPGGNARAFVPSRTKKWLLTDNDDRTHEEITEDAIRELITQSYGNILNDSIENAISVIAQANIATDDDQYTSAKHFDGENFSGAQEFILRNLYDLIWSLNQNNPEAARYSLGYALHTIQDFYSHSNWIELGNRHPNRQIGVPGEVLHALGSNVPTCKSCKPCLPFSDSCKKNLITRYLTSGYYSGEDVKKPGSHKCSHGGALDGSTDGWSGGINKDSEDCGVSPHNYLHQTAARVAVDATKEFIWQVGSMVTPEQFEALLGIRSVAAFAIASEFISESTSQAEEPIFEVALQDKRKKPRRSFLLVPFGDKAGKPLKKRSLKSLKLKRENAKGRKQHRGALKALLKAVETTETGGSVYFIGSGVSDRKLARSIRNLAARKRVRVNPIRPSGTENVEPELEKIALETGGQVLPEVKDGVSEAEELASSDVVNLLSVSGTSSESRMIELPVDSTLSRINLTIGGTSSPVIIRPDGTTVGNSDANFSSTQLGSYVAIQDPVPGRWQIKVEGEFSVVATGLSEINMTSFQFLELKGRPGHQGFTAMNGFPISAQETVVSAKLSDEIISPSFEFRTADGSALKQVEMRKTRYEKDYIGKLNVPSTSFYVYVTGRDKNGFEFQRMLPTLVEPQTIKVSAPSIDNLKSGRSTRYTVEVSNLGETGSFEVSAINGAALQGIEPRVVTIRKGETISLSFRLRPSNSSPDETITFNARKVSDNSCNNFAVIRTPVQ
jgi:von Willebrand factor A domain-containing protein 7